LKASRFHQAFLAPTATANAANVKALDLHLAAFEVVPGEDKVFLARILAGCANLYELTLRLREKTRDCDVLHGLEKAPSSIRALLLSYRTTFSHTFVHLTSTVTRGLHKLHYLEHLALEQVRICPAAGVDILPLKLPGLKQLAIQHCKLDQAILPHLLSATSER
jgi:hypothetical protein